MESLPSRERGLKFDGTGTNLSMEKSLPSRERGLKFEPDTHVVTHAGRSLHGSVD